MVVVVVIDAIEDAERGPGIVREHGRPGFVQPQRPGRRLDPQDQADERNDRDPEERAMLRRSGIVLHLRGYAASCLKPR